MTNTATYKGRASDDLIRIVVWGGAGLLLLLPWVAMRFTDEVAWDATDFIVIGALLAMACGACELVLRASGDLRYRIAAGIAIATGFLTVWVNLAVGMIGSEANAANLLFGGVLIVALVGAALARLRARGMAVAMAATAGAQVLATVLAAVLAGWDIGAALAACFSLPWLVSAVLFHTAAQAR